MSWTLSFEGSEVQSSEDLGGQLRLRLSAASVQGGYLKPVELLFSSATWAGDLPLCMGALSEGLLKTAQGRPLTHIALPGSVAGPLQAEFSFRCGAVLSIQAASLAASCPGEPRFMPSYAC